MASSEVSRVTRTGKPVQTAIFPKTDANRVIYGHQRQEYWDEVARSPETKGWNKYYHKRLPKIYQFLVAPGQKIVEVGCGRGDLLAALKPGVVSVSISPGKWFGVRLNVIQNFVSSKRMPTKFN